MAEGNSDLQHIRHATLEDYEAVMAINETIFHGADYLPVMYSQIVTDPMTRSYVLEIGNDVVCCRSSTVYHKACEKFLLTCHIISESLHKKMRVFQEKKNSVYGQKHFECTLQSCINKKNVSC